MRRGRPTKIDAKPRAYAYLRLSVDKEDSNVQSIEAQRHALRAYAQLHGIEIVEEFVDAGLSGQSVKRPAFKRMLAQAMDGSRPVQIVLMHRLARMARNMRIIFNALDAFAEQEVEAIAVTENFGQGRSKRVAQTITAMMDEQQALDCSIYTCKSRRENARQGFYNGGLIAFGYQTYTARQDGQKQRMKLRVVPTEASVVQEIFDWADMGRGGRWVVKTLNDRGTTLRGAKFSNSNVAGILARGMYAGTYYDKTADDDGNVPDPEDWIAVSCPMIIERDQLERVAALRASRNHRKTAPHIPAGTTMLKGIARCGMPGCTCGMTVRSGKGGRYHYYVCNERVNGSRTCE